MDVGCNIFEEFKIFGNLKNAVKVVKCDENISIEVRSLNWTEKTTAFS